jgi:hypothetical protein
VPQIAGTPNETVQRKRKRNKKDQYVVTGNEFHDPDLGMSTPPETLKPPTITHKKNSIIASPEVSTDLSVEKAKKGKVNAASSPV